MILAANLAYKRQWRGVNSRTPGISELSELLRSAKFHADEAKDDRFRSTSSVSMKVNNLIAGHPQRTGGGLRSTSAEKLVVQKFIDDPNKMMAEAARIRKQI
ncbi:hypothetical protein AS038_09910 [Arthrobacter sp. NIO-1057]|nr:hypothetical protein AS038_09910 [Arthrobacter sp. NIO-1057]